MTRIPIAHLHEQGQDIIIVPLDRSFSHKSRAEQNRVVMTLQAAASSANLAGKVVPVWDAGSGRMAFIAPEQWFPFFRGLSLPLVARMLNRELIFS